MFSNSQKNQSQPNEFKTASENKPKLVPRHLDHGCHVPATKTIKTLVQHLSCSAQLKRKIREANLKSTGFKNAHTKLVLCNNCRGKGGELLQTSSLSSFP